METKSVLFAGVGGQGAILTAMVLVNGLMRAGYDVKMSEVQKRFTCHVLDAASIAGKLGAPRCMNIVLFGAMTRALKLDGIDWEEIICGTVPEKFTELNLAAYRAGREAV